MNIDEQIKESERQLKAAKEELIGLMAGKFLQAIYDSEINFPSKIEESK